MNVPMPEIRAKAASGTGLLGIIATLEASPRMCSIVQSASASLMEAITPFGGVTRAGPHGSMPESDSCA